MKSTTLRTRFCVGLLTFCALLGPVSGAARADLPGQINLDRPGAREFVLDKAHLISPADQTRIKAIADKLLTEKAVPLVVVTIEGMDKHGGAGLRIETFARLLFDQWEVGSEKVNGQPWNHGMLLLVSKNDKKARIELGAGWRRDQDIASQGIMQQRIIPRFRQGQYSAGIVAGVEALDQLARDLKTGKKAGAAVPAAGPHAKNGPPATSPVPMASPERRFGEHTPYRERRSGGGSLFMIVILVIGVGFLFMIVSGIASLFRGARGAGQNWSGNSGPGYGGGQNWGPGATSWGGAPRGGGMGSFLGGAAAGVLGSALYGMLNQRSHASEGQGGGDLWSNDHGNHHSDSGSSFGDSSSGSSFGDSGSFGGGSFDSGFSGGGGATGEW